MALAPMANVTDAAFRTIIAKYGKPDVVWTEFVSTDGLCSSGKGKLLTDLKFSEQERPVVAQIFGAKPENFRKVAKLLQELGFDGIDINMGCPDRAFEKQGSCAALMKNPKLAQEIILATKEAAGKLPVSVKIRIGYNKIELGPWLTTIFKAKPAVISIHARTRKEMSKVPAHWDEIGKATKLAKIYFKDGHRPLILGNGDVTNLEEAYAKVKEYGCDGIMIGRGIFGNPWFFNRTINKHDLPLSEQLKVMIEHTFLFEKMFKGIKSFDLMKKHYKAYVTGFDGAKELRTELFEKAKTAEDVKHIIESHFASNLLI